MEHTCITQKMSRGRHMFVGSEACKLTEILIGQRDTTYTVSISSFPIPAFRPTPALVLHVTKAGVKVCIMRPQLVWGVTGKPLEVSFLHLQTLWSFF